MSGDEIKADEDYVAAWINGTAQCTKTVHPAATDHAKLTMLRMLVLEYPHVSKHPDNLEREIAKLRKK